MVANLTSGGPFYNAMLHLYFAGLVLECMNGLGLTLATLCGTKTSGSVLGILCFVTSWILMPGSATLGPYVNFARYVAGKILDLLQYAAVVVVADIAIPRAVRRLMRLACGSGARDDDQAGWGGDGDYPDDAR